MSADTAAVLAAIAAMRATADDPIGAHGSLSAASEKARAYLPALADVAEAAARLVASEGFVGVLGPPGKKPWLPGCAVFCAFCGGVGYWREKDIQHAPDCPSVALDAALARLAGVGT